MGKVYVEMNTLEAYEEREEKIEVKKTHRYSRLEKLFYDSFTAVLSSVVFYKFLSVLENRIVRGGLSLFLGIVLVVLLNAFYYEKD